MSRIHKQLHMLEDEIIQISGLIKALQQILPDSSEHTCLTNAIEERFDRLSEQFYELWKILTYK
ncbi:MAG: hypothetical protein JXR03_18355 [Cyclobacteriaceae bacterium]